MRSSITESDNIAEANNKRLYSYAVYLMLATAPVMFIIRMLCQETAKGFSWREYTYTYVPNNMKAVMIVLMGLSLISSMVLKSKSGVIGKKALYIGWPIVLLISIIIVFMA